MILVLISAVLTLYTGDVKVKRGGEIFDAFINMELSEGDTIITGEDSKAEIMERDSSVIVLDKNTTFTIIEEEKKRSFFLSLGSIWARVKKLAGWDFHIDSPITVAGVRGTEFYMTVSPDSGEVGVIEGKVDVLDKRGGKHYLLEKMKRFRRTKRRAILERLQERKIRRWAEWNKRDLDKLMRLAEKGNPGAIKAANILSKRLGLKDIQQRIEEIKEKQEGTGVRNRELLMKVRIRHLEADLSLLERRVRRIELGIGSLKNLIKNKRYRMARTLSMEIEGLITRNIPFAGNLESRAIKIHKDLRRTLRETNKIKDEEVKKSVRKEIIRDLRKVGLLKDRIKTAKRKLVVVKKVLLKVKQQLNP